MASRNPTNTRLDRASVRSRGTSRRSHQELGETWTWPERRPSGPAIAREIEREAAPWDWSADLSTGVPLACLLFGVLLGQVAIVFGAAVALHEAWGWSPVVVQCLGGLALLLAGHRPVMRARLRRKARVFTVAAVMVWCLAAAGHVDALDKKTVAVNAVGRLPSLPHPPLWTASPVSGSVTSLVAIGRQTFGWGGDEISALAPGVGTTMRIPGLIHAVLPCGNSLIVDYGAHLVARFSLALARRMTRAWPMPGPRSGWSCAHGTLAIGVQPEGPGTGSVFELDLSTMAFQRAFAIDGRVGPIEQRFGQLLVAGDDGPGQLRRIDRASGAFLKPVTALPEVSDLLPADNGVIAVERGRSCLRRVDLEQERAPRGTLLTSTPRAVAYGHAQVTTLSGDGRSVQAYDAHSLRPLGRALALADGMRGRALVATAGGWSVLARGARQLLSVDVAALVAKSGTKLPSTASCA